MLTHFSEYGYLGVFVALLASGIGVPIPEELPILTAGVMVGHANTPHPAGAGGLMNPHRLHWWIMVPVCMAGVVIGDGFLYLIGRFWGSRLLDHPWVQRKLIPADKREIIEKNFHDRGVMILLTARLTPGIRTPIFIMAGVLRVPWARFLFADGLYAIPGVNVMFWMAYFLTDQVLEAFHKAEQYRPLLIFGILSAALGIMLWRLLANRHVTTGSPAEVPMLIKPVEKVTEAVEHAVEKALVKVTHRGLGDTGSSSRLAKASGHVQLPHDQPLEHTAIPIEPSLNGKKPTFPIGATPKQ